MTSRFYPFVTLNFDKPNMADFRHETAGRRPITVIALIFMLALGIIGVNKGMLQDPVGILVALIWLATTALMAWMVAANPKTGITVKKDGIEWWDGKRYGFVPRYELQAFEVSDWSDSTDYCLRLSDGSKVQLAAMADLDLNELGNALKRQQIPLSIR